MDKLKHITQAVKHNRLDYAQLTLARYLLELHPAATELCLHLAVLVNHEIQQGNVCLSIKDIAKRSEALLLCPVTDIHSLQQSIQNSPIIGSQNENKPLVFDLNKLYLNRYFYYEKQLAEQLLTLAKSPALAKRVNTDLINQLFDSRENPDYQKIAALVSSQHQLCIISGGPGTGKTRTVSHILSLLLQQNPELKIKLAAPTGKAAARLSQSIQQSRSQMTHDLFAAQQIPDKAITLHRLLGIHRYTHRPRYNADYPLNCDVLVLDEASMIDQQMMAVVCAALPAQARLILLGDKDQLSSVEAGSVFADLCGELKGTQFSKAQCKWIRQTLDYQIAEYTGDYRLADQVVVLQKSYRFDSDSGIGQLARLINTGDSTASLQFLMESQPAQKVQWQQLSDQQLNEQLIQQALQYYQQIIKAKDVEEAFKCFYSFQILAAVWDGVSGVDQINSVIEQALKRHNKISDDSLYFAGMPLMMSSNMYQYGIHNGDIGIIWPDDENGQLKVWFEADDQGYRALSLSQLPESKSAYAMTVHKSQGSEFERVLMILPGYESSVCTRELLYTAITRARDSVEIWGLGSVIESAVERKTQRVSGLLERLSGP